MQLDPKDKLIVALDVDLYREAVEIIEKLEDTVDIFKVGIAPFTAFGEALLEVLARKKKKVFLDLKFHDIPNTVKNAARAAADKKVFMMNFHCIGGAGMMEAAANGVKAAGPGQRPILLGVTVLTSMSDEDLGKLGIAGTVEEKVLDFAKLARASGMDGVVASAREARIIKEKIGKDFIVVTPGVRPDWAAKGDQKRIETPRSAIEAGADFLVVGRPIIEADEPAKAAEKILAEMAG